MLENWRIHLLGMGYESSWILKSLEKSRADKVYLFCRADEKKTEALQAEKETINFLKKNKIVYEKISYNSKDIFSLLKIVRGIIDKEKNNYFNLNISSGERHVAVSFTLASILFKRIPKELRLYSMEGGGFEIIPSFEAKLPEKELIEAMKFISENGNECSKSALKKYLFEQKILKTDKEGSNEYMLLYRKITQKLLQWGFIQLEGFGKGSLIKLKEEGQDLIKLL